MTDPNEDKMPLTAHLEELRKRLVRSLIAVGIAFLACFFFKEELFGIVARPLIGVLPPGSHLIYTGLPEAFFTYMKVAVFGALFIAFSRWTKRTFAIYGAALLPFFWFNYHFTITEPVFNSYMLIDVVSNTVMLTLCVVGWRALEPVSAPEPATDK